jgi:hypothetical protein
LHPLQTLYPQHSNWNRKQTDHRLVNEGTIVEGVRPYGSHGKNIKFKVLENAVLCNFTNTKPHSVTFQKTQANGLPVSARFQLPADLQGHGTKLPVAAVPSGTQGQECQLVKQCWMALKHKRKHKLLALCTELWDDITNGALWYSRMSKTSRLLFITMSFTYSCSLLGSGIGGGATSQFRSIKLLETPSETWTLALTYQ